MAGRRRSRRRQAGTQGQLEAALSGAAAAPRSPDVVLPLQAAPAARESIDSPAAKARDRQETVALICALIALAVACISLAPTLAYVGWNPSVTLHIAVSNSVFYRLIRSSTPNLVTVPGWTTYDSALYYAMARDPLGLGIFHQLPAWMPYRYQHAGYSWLAFIASFGFAPLLPNVMLCLNLALFALSGYILSLLAVQIGRSPWWGLLVAVDPGLLMAINYDTTEVTLACAVLLGLFLWLRRHPAAGAAVAAACFAKELGWALPVGLGLYETAAFARAHYPSLGEMSRARLGELIGAARESGLARRLAILLIGPALSSLWFAYDEIVIAPTSNFLAGYAPRNVASSLVHVPLRLVPVAGLWLLPLFVAVALALLLRGSRALRGRALRPPAIPLAALAVVALVLAALLLWGSVHAGGFQNALDRAQASSRAALEIVMAKAGFRGYDLLPFAGIADGLTSAAVMSRQSSGEQVPIGFSMLPVALAACGAALLGLIASLSLRTPPKAIFVIVAVPILSLYPTALLFPEDLIRTMAVPLLMLALALLAPGNRFPEGEPAR
jgi:hypothetical protein